MTKLMKIGAAGILGLGGLVAFAAGGGNSFKAKIQGGGEVAVDYAAIKDYVEAMEATGEVEPAGDVYLQIPVSYKIKKAFSEIMVTNEDSSKDTPTAIAGGKVGETRKETLVVAHAKSVTFKIFTVQE